MEKKFECRQCKNTFAADDQGVVVCPHCHSDNVEIASSKITKHVKYAIFSLIVAGLFGLSIMQISKCSGNASGERADSDSMFVDTTGQMPVLPPLEGQLPILSMRPEVPVFENDGYSFSIVVEYPPTEAYKFVVLETFEEKIVAESRDGKFSSVPFSKEEGGAYRVKLLSADGQRDLSDPMPIIGFIKQQPVAKKMTVQELQHLLDAGDDSLLGVGENDYLAPELKIKYNNLPKGVINVPKTIGELYADKIVMGLWDVKVASLEYDDMNRITTVVFRVIDKSLNLDADFNENIYE